MLEQCSKRAVEFMQKSKAELLLPDFQMPMLHPGMTGAPRPTIMSALRVAPSQVFLDALGEKLLLLGLFWRRSKAFADLVLLSLLFPSQLLRLGFRRQSCSRNA